MRKRAFERVQSDVHVNFLFSDVIYTGVVKNLSENGMCINSENCLPHKSKFEILFPHNEEVLKLPAMVNRSFKKNSFYEAMGVELLNPPIKYLEFVYRLRLKSPQHLKTVGHWSRFATQLICVHCNNIHRTHKWPLRGDDGAIYFGKEPSNFNLKVTCPNCMKDWYVYWYEDPGPIMPLDL